MTDPIIPSLAGPRPIMLSGVYRSGTTFLTAVLNNLPNIAAGSSTVKYLRFCSPHFDLSSPETLRTMLVQIAERVSARWSLTLDTEKIQAEFEGTEINHASAYDAVMRSLLLDDKPGATRWAEKLAAQWRDIPLFLQMFPDGQVIHIFRDPRDVTASYKKMTYEPEPTFLDAALNAKAAMTELPGLQNRFGKNRILMLKAEDLALNSSETIRGICEFLDEPFTRELAEFDQYSDIKGEDWRTNSSFDQSGQNYAEAKPRWREALTPEELFLVEMICQPQMAEFGYKGSGQDVTTLNFIALQSILTDEWFGARIQKYLSDGMPDQGYRTDPYSTEMKIVFGDDWEKKL